MMMENAIDRLNGAIADSDCRRIRVLIQTNDFSSREKKKAMRAIEEIELSLES